MREMKVKQELEENQRIFEQQKTKIEQDQNMKFDPMLKRWFFRMCPRG